MSQALTRSTALPCHRKEAYTSRKLAEAANRWYQQHQFAAYKCQYCRRWHITFTK